MLRAPRSMPNSSGGTPMTRACANLRVVTMVTSWVTAGAADCGDDRDSRGAGMVMVRRLRRRERNFMARHAADLKARLPIRYACREVLRGRIVAQIVEQDPGNPPGRYYDVVGCKPFCGSTGCVDRCGSKLSMVDSGQPFHCRADS